MESEHVIRIDTPKHYCELFGLEAESPLVTTIDLSKATRYPETFSMNYGLYALYLKHTRCGDIRYGQSIYDYQEGTVTSFAPGQIVKVEKNTDIKPNAVGLLFHPDFIKGTSLGQSIKNYSFFSYASTEALHLSDEEKVLFTDCLNKIGDELRRPFDKHSKRLISKNIELLLDYCLRFYERQFTCRSDANKTVLSKFEALLDAYLSEKKTRTEGLPTVRYFADKVFLSPNYFGDLVKKETGKTAQEYIQDKIIDHAKEILIGTEMTISEIAYELGYQYSQHFNRIFKKHAGCTPTEYRQIR